MMKLSFKNTIFRVRFFLMIACALFTFNYGSEAHTFHTTLTRIDYNTKEKSAEISIRMFTHDLVPTLEAISKQRIDLEKTKNVDKMIFDFVRKNFVLTNKNGEIKQLAWVGFEFEVDTVYVYIETKMPEGLENARLQNTLFFDYFPEQSNLVICKIEEKKADLAFKVGDKTMEIIPKENK
jgi:hypothetical protein